METGRQKNIESPQQLLDLWNEYKDYIDHNPDVQQVATGKGVFKIEVKRPYQKKGFLSFVFNKLGFHVYQYIDNISGAYNEFLCVVTHMRAEWECDQIEGTLTGRYKAPNLVARLNSIKDNVDESGTKEVIIRVKHERKGTGGDTTGTSSGAGEDTE